MKTTQRKRVLILCTGNSCRSQMAEGPWRLLGGSEWEVYSAGSEPTGFVHPLAIEVMRERDIDISGQTSKSLSGLAKVSFDLIVTVCDAAQGACPTFAGGGRRLHWPFPDPARENGPEDVKRQAFRRVRDEIAERIESFLREF